MIKNFIGSYLSRIGFVKAEALPADVRKWLLPESEAEKWMMPDPAVYANQADLYRKLSYIGTVVDMVADACIDSDFDITNENGEESETHPFVQLLDDPNPYDSRTEFLRAHFAWRKISGNSYWYLNRTSDKTAPDEIWILPPSKIIPVPDNKMGLRGYLYSPGNGDQIPLEPYEVMHFKSFNPASRYLGLSSIESLAFTSTGALASQEWNTRLFAENNARLPGILAFAEMIQDTDWDKMKAAVQDATKKRNQMMLRGVGKGGVEWMQASATQREMEFLAGLQMSKQDIYDRLAPGLFSAMQTSALTNGENGLYLFAKYSIAPLLRELTDKINSDLLPVYSEGWTAEYEDVVPEDKTLEMAKIDQFAKFHTVDEVRVEMFGNKPDPDRERGSLFASQITAKSESKEKGPAGIQEVIPGEATAPTDMTPEIEEEKEEDDTLIKLMKSDLSNWKKKAIKNVGTETSWTFTSDYIPEGMAEGLRLHLQECKTAEDVASVFKKSLALKSVVINKEGSTDAPPPDDKAIKSLAASIEALILSEKAEVVQPIYNMTMPAINLTAQMPPNGTVTVNIPEQPAPAVNITVPETVVNNSINVEPAINNVTVQPAKLVLPAAPTEAEIVTLKDGTRKLMVTK